MIRREKFKPKATTNDAPDGCRHYTDLAEMPWGIQKYYQQRYSIFSRYDEGIWMTEDAWFGVTPEPIANKIAQHLSNAITTDKAILIDCFAGVGGNAIAFACSGKWRRVYAIEKDGKALECAKHNANIYGVQDQISWYWGDCFGVLRNELADLGAHCVIFASPPWGGPGYKTDEVFNLSTMQPYNLQQLLDPFRNYSENVVLYLPRTSDMRQLANATNGDKKTVVMHYCMEGASKAICAHFGLFNSQAIIQASGSEN